MKFPKTLVSISIFINNLTGGPRGWSICARLYEARLNGSKFGKWAVEATDTLFWFDPQHCRRAWLMRN